MSEFDPQQTVKLVSAIEFRGASAVLWCDNVRASCGGESLLYLRVTISRYVDAAFPGWVECSMVDATGHEHLFVEKVPAVTLAALDDTSHFPQPGFIACIVIGRNTRDDGSQLVRIGTQTTTVGRTEFDVFSEQLCEFPREEGGR